MNKREQLQYKKAKYKMIKVFRGILIVPTLIWLIICLISLVFPGLINTLNFDLGENRKLADYPKELSDDYFSQVEKYYNDHAPFRSILISLNDKMRFMVEAPYDNGLRDSLVAAFHTNESAAIKPSETQTTIDINNIFGTSSSSQTTEVTTSSVVDISVSATETLASSEESFSSESSIEITEPVTESQTTIARETLEVPTEAVETGYYAPVIANDYVILGRSQWLFLAGNNLDYYIGADLASDSELQNYVSTLNRLKEVCDAKGKKVAILLVPCKPQVYSEYMPTYEVVNTYKRVARIVDYANQNSTIAIKYPLNEMLAMKDYFLTYKKYDGHWNAAGAFLGYQMVLQMLGMQTTNILDVNVEMYPVGSGGGDLISPGALNVANYQMDYDYTFHYKDEVQLLGTEGEYFKNNTYYRAYSNASNNSQVTVIGDSFRNHMVLYMYKDFTDSTLVHADLLGDATVDNILLESDTYVMMFVERNDKRVLTTAEYLINLLSK